jgi:uncharacterized membrane protein YbhN (UPF0104 family)
VIVADQEPGAALAERATTLAMPWRSRRAVLHTALALLVTVLLLAFLFGRAGLGRTLEALAQARPELLAVALALTLTLPILHAFRLRLVLDAAGYAVGWRRCFVLVMAAWPVSSATPAKAGDLLKAYFLRVEVPAAVSVGCLLTERVVDLLVLAGLALLGAMLHGMTALAVVSACVFGGSILGLGLLPLATHLPLSGRWRERLAPLWACSRAVSRRPRTLLLALALTGALWFMTMLVTLILFTALGAHVPALYALAGLPPALFAGSLPFATGGIGARDSVLMAMFEGYATEAQALGAGLLYALYFRVLLAVLGLPYLRLALRARPRDQAASVDEVQSRPVRAESGSV